MEIYFRTFLYVFFFVLQISCNMDDPKIEAEIETDDKLKTTSDLGISSSSFGGSSVGQQGGQKEGLITAGEWNDLDNWDLWNTFLQTDDFSKLPEYWELYTKNRFKVKISDGEKPVVNVTVNLLDNNTVIWTSKTDVYGYAELFASPFKYNLISDLSSYSIQINNSQTINDLKLIKQGVNEINIKDIEVLTKRVEIAFIVDATGSMSDEINFLKADLKSVIQNIENSKPNSDIYTATVFYRDVDDYYLYRKSGFSSDVDTTVNFITQQNAGGGGDFPEAVEVALEKTLSELQWSDDAFSRLAFLLLDAPPHHTPIVIGKLQSYIKEFAKKGIKIIPITASGIDKKTEFLMRHFSMFTNGTYVFITNDSGIGNEHIEATVGDYEVEILKDLIIRLINKYTQE